MLCSQRAHLRLLQSRMCVCCILQEPYELIVWQCRSRVKIIGGAHHERQSHEVLGSPGECSSGKFLYRGSLK